MRPDLVETEEYDALINMPGGCFGVFKFGDLIKTFACKLDSEYSASEHAIREAFKGIADELIMALRKHKGKEIDGKLVRIRIGAIVWMDFSMWTWPNLPHGDESIVFETSSISPMAGYVSCMADNFGFFPPRGKYGNGCLCVKLSDLIPIGDHEKSAG
jgi:hypothetical protein